MISAETHAAVVRGVEFGASDTGTESAAISCQLTSGEFEGEFITCYAYLTDRAFERSVETLKSAGWSGSGQMTDAAEECPGTKVSLVVEHDTYQGDTRAKVKWLNRPGGLGVKNPFDSNQRASFDERMEAKMAAMNAGTPDAHEEEIPF